MNEAESYAFGMELERDSVIAECKQMQKDLDAQGKLADTLADALASFVADAEVSSESYDRVAEEFRRDTGFLAPGKDEAAAVNSGVTHEERSHAWNIWVGKRRRVQLENGRAALRAAGRLP